MPRNKGVGRAKKKHRAPLGGVDENVLASAAVDPEHDAKKLDAVRDDDVCPGASATCAPSSVDGPDAAMGDGGALEEDSATAAHLVDDGSAVLQVREGGGEAPGTHNQIRGRLRARTLSRSLPFRAEPSPLACAER